MLPKVDDGLNVVKNRADSDSGVSSESKTSPKHSGMKLQPNMQSSFNMVITRTNLNRLVNGVEFSVPPTEESIDSDSESMDDNCLLPDYLDETSDGDSETSSNGSALSEQQGETTEYNCWITSPQIVAFSFSDIVTTEESFLDFAKLEPYTGSVEKKLGLFAVHSDSSAESDNNLDDDDESDVNSDDTEFLSESNLVPETDECSDKSAYTETIASEKAVSSEAIMREAKEFNFTKPQKLPVSRAACTKVKNPPRFMDDDCISLHANSEFDFNEPLPMKQNTIQFPVKKTYHSEPQTNNLNHNLSECVPKFKIIENMVCNSNLHSKIPNSPHRNLDYEEKRLPNQSIYNIIDCPELCAVTKCLCSKFHIDAELISKEVASKLANEQERLWYQCLRNERSLQLLAKIFAEAACMAPNFPLLATIVKHVMEAGRVYDKKPVLKCIITSMETTAQLSFGTAITSIMKMMEASRSICDVLLSIVIEENDFLRQYWTQISVLISHATHPIDTMVFEPMLVEAACSAATLNNSILISLNNLLENEEYVDAKFIGSATLKSFKSLPVFQKNVVKASSPKKDLRELLRSTDYWKLIELFKNNLSHPNALIGEIVATISTLKPIDWNKFLSLFKCAAVKMLDENQEFRPVLMLITFSILPELHGRKDFETGAILLKMFEKNISEFGKIDCLTRYVKFKNILRYPHEKMLFILKFFLRSSESQCAINIIKKESVLNDRSTPKFHMTKMRVIEEFLCKLFSNGKLFELHDLMCHLVESSSDQNDLKYGYKVWQYLNAFFDRVVTLSRSEQCSILEYSPTIFKYYSHIDISLLKSIIERLYEENMQIDNLDYLLDCCKALYPLNPTFIQVLDSYSETEIQLCAHIFFHRMLKAREVPREVRIHVLRSVVDDGLRTDFLLRLNRAFLTFKVCNLELEANDLEISHANVKIILEKMRRNTLLSCYS